MKAHKLILFIALIIVLEAVTDGLIYLSQTTYLTGVYHHITQILFAGSILFFGIYIGKCKAYADELLFILIAGTCLHFGLFDILYGSITGNWVGTNSIADKIYSILPILNNVIIRMMVAFGGIVLLIVKFPYKNNH